MNASPDAGATTTTKVSSSPSASVASSGICTAAFSNVSAVVPCATGAWFVTVTCAVTSLLVNSASRATSENVSMPTKPGTGVYVITRPSCTADPFVGKLVNSNVSASRSGSVALTMISAVMFFVVVTGSIAAIEGGWLGSVTSTTTSSGAEAAPSPSVTRTVNPS